MMVTAQSVKNKLEGLISKANGVTGKNDGTVSAAVDALISGFGQGGADTLTARLDGSISGYTNSNLTTIPDYGFYGCTSLAQVSCPNLTAIGRYAFSGCTALTEFDFSNVNLPAGYGSVNAFENTGLTHVVLPKMATIPYNFFERCGNLNVVDCHAVTMLQMQAFRYCTSLTTLILRKTDGVAYTASNTFDNCGFGSDGKVCAVYVPQSLLEQYKVATNWSALLELGQIAFFAIEGSEYQ